MSEPNKNKKTIKQYFKEFIPHFKTMKVKDIVIVCFEFALFLLLFILFINFFVDLIKGIHFLGDSLIAYEIVVVVFLFLLAGFTLFQVIFDLIFKNYTVDQPTKKVIKNGMVIEIKEENNQPEEESNTDTKENN